MTLRLVLADSHQIVRQGCRTLLQREGFAIAGEAADGREAVRLALAHHPDIAILDWSMPLLSGLNAARDIRQRCPRTSVVLLTLHREDYQITAAFRAGIRAYVAKTQVAYELVTAIHEVAAGRTFLSPSLRRHRGLTRIFAAGRAVVVYLLCDALQVGVSATL